MSEFETLIVSVPAVVIIAVGALFALRFLFRRRVTLLRIGVAALIVGFAFSAAYFWNLTVTPRLLEVQLTEQQKEILAKLELPEELEELSAEQKKAVVRIDKMLTYLEEKYSMDFYYSGYTAGEVLGEEKLTAFPAGGNPLTETVTVKTDNWGDFTDDFAWVHSRAIYNKEVKWVFEDQLKDNCAKVLTVSGESKVTDVNGLELGDLFGKFQADSIVFIRGEFTEDQLVAAAEAFGAWAAANGICGTAQVIQLDAEQLWGTITEGNYKDILDGDGVGLRVSCTVESNRTFYVS